MMTLETVSVSTTDADFTDPYRDAIEAALLAYRDAARGVSPDPAFIVPSGEGLEVERAEVETILAAARHRAVGGRVRQAVIGRFFEPVPPETTLRGRVRAVLRLLAEPNHSVSEQKDLTTAIGRLFLGSGHQVYGEALSCFEQEPKLRTVPALVEALRASDAHTVATAFDTFRGLWFWIPIVCVWYWLAQRFEYPMIGIFVSPLAIAVLTLLGVWTRSKRRRKSCVPLLRMLEDVEIADPKTRKWALQPIRMVAKSGAAQPRSVRQQAQRLTRRRWDHSAEYLPVSATHPTPTAESLPVPSDCADTNKGEPDCRKRPLEHP